MSKGGQLYACGCAGGKGQVYLPVKNIDSSGDCPFPEPILLPKGAANLKFTKAAADMGIFAALDTQGGLWAWGKSHSIDIDSNLRQIAEGVVDFDVGARFIAAIYGNGRIGIHGMLDSKWPKASLDQPVLLPEEGPWKQVAACNESIVAINSVDGQAYSMGSGINVGQPDDMAQLTPLPGVPPAVMVTLGSRHGGLITADGKIFVWGDGLSGALGVGQRITQKTPIEVPPFCEAGVTPVHISCTRGQPECKRVRTAEGITGGQEGQRTHVVTSDGGLWIAGTTHKGMGADHLHKVNAAGEGPLDVLPSRRNGTGSQETPTSSHGCSGRSQGRRSCCCLSAHGIEGRFTIR